MKTRRLFLKFVIVLAVLSLILVALAPVIYVFAPSVSGPVVPEVEDTQVLEETP